MAFVVKLIQQNPLVNCEDPCKGTIRTGSKGLALFCDIFAYGYLCLRVGRVLQVVLHVSLLAM